jgi:adenosylhomocysteine nucleosidase
MILLIGAVREEVLPVRKALCLNRRDPDLPFPAYRAAGHERPTLLIQSGIGRGRAQEAATHVVRREPIARMISFGFCGALVDGLNIGEIVLYSSMQCEKEGSGKEEITEYRSDEQLIASAGRALVGIDGTVRTLPGLTTDRLLATSKQKQTLAVRYAADVVDMESFWLAAVAASQGIPFLAIRAISDRLEDTMPQSTGRVLSTEVSRVRLLIDASLHPRQLTSLVRLAWNARIAMHRLVPCLDRLVRIDEMSMEEER